MMENNMLIDYSENSYSISTTIKKLSSKYLNEFIRLKCAPDLLMFKLFPNIKEITESMAVYNTVRKYLQNEFPLSSRDVTCLVVGDGHMPRTGALFAFRTNWDVISVDPNMFKDKPPLLRINRLLSVKGKIENFDNLLQHIKTQKVLVVCVHSHAKLSACVAQLKEKEITVISMPCCVPDDLNIVPEISYDDWGIHSPKRTINIYKIK